jgi:hypothetical protein
MPATLGADRPGLAAQIVSLITRQPNEGRSTVGSAVSLSRLRPLT